MSQSNGSTVNVVTTVYFGPPSEIGFLIFSLGQSHSWNIIYTRIQPNFSRSFLIISIGCITVL